MWEGKGWEAYTPNPEPRPASPMPLSTYVLEIISKACYYVKSLTHMCLI